MLNPFRKQRLSQAIIYTSLTVIVFLTLYPLLYMFMNSFKNQGGIKSNPWFPDFQHIHFENYKFALEVVPHSILNSVIVSLTTAAGILVVASITAYIFARFEFPFKSILFTAIIMVMMIPGILTFIPTFVVVKNLGLIDSYWVMILPGIAGGQVFSIFLLRSFFEQVPNELLESARIDGAKEKTVLLKVILPLSISMFMTLGVLNVLSSWNSYIWPLVTLKNSAKWTIPIAINYLTVTNYDINITLQFAAYVVASVPLIVLFAFTMDYFIEGLTSGAVKA